MKIRMKPPLQSSLALCIFATCLTHAGLGRADMDDMLSHELTRGLTCASNQNTYDCLSAHEASAAEAHGVELRSSSREFCFSVGSRDFCLGRAADLRYIFLGRSHGHLEILEIASEGFEVLLIDEITSTITRIDNRPIYSPTGDSFATVAFDIDASYIPNRVVIWDSKSKKIVYQLDGFPEQTGPVAIRWIDGQHIAVLYIFAEGTKFTHKIGSVWKDHDDLWIDNVK